MDPKFQWTDHYVESGLAVVPALVDTLYAKEALEEVKRIVGNGLPLEEWTVTNAPKKTWAIEGRWDTPVPNRIYDRQRLRAAIDEMFGSPDAFHNDRRFKLFIKPFDPAAKSELTPPRRNRKSRRR